MSIELESPDIHWMRRALELEPALSRPSLIRMVSGRG